MRTELDINSNDNSLFVTSQCNNQCLMCCQPPLDIDDIEYHFKRNLEIIKSAPKNLTDIGITGGEPTLLKDKLFLLIELIKHTLPNTLIHILTNGRLFSDIIFTEKLFQLGTNNILLGIPLHSDYYKDHDIITQSNNSFHETIKGLYNLAKYDFKIELRIIINQINYSRLPKLAEFIYKNIPFTSYISFIGLEDTGYSIKNHNQIWIDPIDYQNYLEEAIIYLASLGLNVSIFNIPYCLLKKDLYNFACKSISNWKVSFMDFCPNCSFYDKCCGLFSTSKIQSSNLHPIYF